MKTYKLKILWSCIPDTDYYLHYYTKDTYLFLWHDPYIPGRVHLRAVLSELFLSHRQQMSLNI